MMTLFGLPHILMLLSSIALLVLLMFIISKLSPRWQNVMICSFVAIAMFGIFFLHATNRGTKFDIVNLLIQQLQVCNFNFILLPLCLIPKNEIGRQYLFYFSMFAAASTFFAYPSDVMQSQWYSIVCLNFWINHFCVVAVPLMMLATKRFKPKKEYCLKVTLCVAGYFLLAHCGNLILNNISYGNTLHNHSYTINAGSILVLKPIFQLIPVAFVYLLPLAPVIFLLFLFLAFLFKKYETKENYGNFINFSKNTNNFVKNSKKTN